MTNRHESLFALWGWRNAARNLENARFEGETFKSLSFGPGTIPGSAVSVGNCVFSNCRVDGEFSISEAVELDDVIFEDVISPNMMTILTPVILKDVVVRSKKQVPGLWVKPQEETNYRHPGQKALCEKWSSDASAGIKCMFDFSGLNAKAVEVLGLPLSKLKWDVERHVPVMLSWKESAAWSYVSTRGFWSFAVANLKIFDVTEGVYSFPTPRDSSYARAMEDRKVLLDYGLLRSTYE